jgi:hypothetical protein
MATPADATPPARSTAFPLALVAALIAFVIPLLPLYGDGLVFLWDGGFPARVVIQVLLSRWTPAIVIAVGLLLLSRGRSSIAAGVFGAIALTIGLDIVGEVVLVGGVFSRWQSTLVVVLWAVEATLLAAAALITARDPAASPAARDVADG